MGRKLMSELNRMISCLRVSPPYLAYSTTPEVGLAM